jgi:hypothetical protein
MRHKLALGLQGAMALATLYSYFLSAIVAIRFVSRARCPRMPGKQDEWLLDGVFYFSLAKSICWRWRMKGLRCRSRLLVFHPHISGAGFAAG